MAPMVYIVDDEPNIRRLISFALKDEGFESREFAGGKEFLAALSGKLPDAVVLDWMMPDPDGVKVCRILREKEHTRPLPVLMLTARSDEIDRVLGLEMGADDYLTKPFSMKELCARLRALLRRKEYLKGDTPQVLRGGPIVMDPEKRRVTRNAQELNLTMKEFDLLHVLMQNKGRVMTRDALLDKVWGVDYFGDTRTVDVHIRYLRQKVEEQPEHPQLIQTVRGVGYRFVDEEETQ